MSTTINKAIFTGNPLINKDYSDPAGSDNYFPL